jgi:hypothetical protein
MLLRFTFLLLFSFDAGAILLDTKGAIIDAARTFNVNPCLIQAMLIQEGGAVGKDTYHSNGAVDIGIAQVNKDGAWNRYYNNLGITTEMIRDNPLISVLVMPNILQIEYSKSGDLIQAISAYHRGFGNRDTVRGYRYAQSVLGHFKVLVKKQLCYATK